MHFEGAGEVIRDVAGFEDEHSNLCADPWAPFNSAEGFKLASWFIDGKVSKTRINDYFSSGLGNAQSGGYSSMHTLENHLRFLDPYSQYLQWFEGQVEDGQRTLPFFYRVVSDISFARSHTEMTWSTRHGVNMTLPGREYMLKCIRRIGGGTCR